MNSTVAPQQQQQFEVLKRQEIASEWDRWRAHGARQEWPSGRQSSRHNDTTSDEPTSTTPDHNPHVHFKQLLDHSCSSSNIQEKQQQHQQPRTWENEVPYRSSSWPAMFGAPDQHTAQVRILQVIVLEFSVHDKRCRSFSNLSCFRLSQITVHIAYNWRCRNNPILMQ